MSSLFKSEQGKSEIISTLELQSDTLVEFSYGGPLWGAPELSTGTRLKVWNLINKSAITFQDV